MAKSLVDHKVHKYQKAKLGSQIIYRCVLPDCKHYLLRKLVVNKLCLCNRCGAPFVLPKAPSLLKAKPWCDQCEETRKLKKEKPTIPADVMNRILGSFK